MRLWRTVHHLSSTQVAHRLRLRARAAARRRFPAAGERLSTPPLSSPFRAPLPLLRPCSAEVVGGRAESAAAGRFDFVGVERAFPGSPFPAPADAPLLYAYHLEYMDYLLDLVLCGHREAAGGLLRARVESDGIHRPSGSHPYTDSRRTAALLRLLPVAGSSLRAAAAAAAWRYANRLLRNVEWDVGGNHLLENGLALALAGVAFSGSRARVMREMGRRILWETGLSQILKDGGHYELSPMYHARVLAVLLEGTLALEHGGLAAPASVYGALARMTRFLAGIVDGKGRLPLIGDASREADLDPSVLVHAAAACLPVEVSAPPRGDRAYPDSGLYVFEDAERGNRLLLDAGPTCPERLGAHGQADTFTFELDVGGRAFVVDPGVYEYAAGPMRSYARSTRSHSTVEVDGGNSSEVWSSFRVGRRARVTVLYHRMDGGLATLAAAHDGYSHRGAEHRRTVAHLDRGLWLVGDRVRAKRPATAVSRLHLHPDVQASIGERGVVRLVRDGTKLDVVPFGEASTSWESGRHSPRFGERRESRVLCLTFAGQNAVAGYLLSAGGGEPPVVRGREVVEVVASARRYVRALA